MDNKANIIRKIRACLARADEARNDSEAERATALRQANALMDKHNIDVLQLQEGSAPLGEIGQSSFTSGNDRWKASVGKAIGDLYGCPVYYEPGYYGATFVTGPEVLRNVVVDMAQYVIDSILREVDVAGQGMGRKFRTSFKNGAASGVHTTVRRILKDRAAAPASDAGGALVLVDHYKQQLVENKAWLEEQGVTVTKGSRSSSNDARAWHQGHQHGAGIALNDQIGNS